MTIKNFVKDVLKIEEDGFFDNENFILDIMNSDEYGRIFSILEHNDEVIQLEDESIVNAHASSIKYEAENHPFLLTLNADFDGDVFALTVKEI